MKDNVQYSENSHVSGWEDKMIVRSKMRESSQAGSVLIFIIVAMTIVAIMGAAIMSLTSSSTFSGLFINNRHNAYYLAQAGRNYATMTILNAYNSADVAVITALNGQTFTLPDGNKFYLTTKKESAGITTVESTGIANPGTATETKQKIVFTVRDPTVISGAASTGIFKLSGGAVIDGYSSVGGHVYNEAEDKTKNLAVIRTNTCTTGGVSLTASSVVYGKAYCGATCAAADPCDALGGIFVCYSGSTIKLGTALSETNYPTPVLSIPAGGELKTIIGSEDSLQNKVTNIGVAGTVTKYRARNDSGGTELHVNNSIINIYGDVTLIVDYQLYMTNGAKIVLHDNATLVLWINELLSASGSSTLNIRADGVTPGEPPNLLIKGIEVTTLTFNNTGRIYCSIYAPGADLNVDGTSEVFGSFYARNISLNNGAKLHCDMALSEGADQYGGY